MISTFTVFIDANVFYGHRLRSLVMYLAQTKMFRARWSEKVHDEWTRNLAHNNKIDISKLGKIRTLMNTAVPDASVTGYDMLENSFELPDPDDKHILAAAVLTRADLIMTFDVKDFPADILEPLRLATIHPDIFLQDCFGISKPLFIDAVQKDFAHYIDPNLKFLDYVEGFRKAGVPETANLINELRVVIETESNSI